MSPAYDWRQLLPAAVEHDRRATQFRPTEPAALIVEARRLRTQGLLPRDIGQALGLSAEQVRQYLTDGAE